MFPNAADLRKLSDDREKLRIQRNNEKDTVVNKYHLERIKDAITMDTAIYFGMATIELELGKATIAHLKSLGYKVTDGRSLREYIISW